MNFVFINSGELIVAAKRSNYSQPATQSLAQYCKCVQKTQIMIDIGGASSLTLSQHLSFNDIFFQCFLIYLLFGLFVCVDTLKEGCSLSIMNH